MAEREGAGHGGRDQADDLDQPDVAARRRAAERADLAGVGHEAQLQRIGPRGAEDAQPDRDQREQERSREDDVAEAADADQLALALRARGVVGRQQHVPLERLDRAAAARELPDQLAHRDAARVVLRQVAVDVRLQARELAAHVVG